ncbi:hypothetical protein BUE93_22190 [Chromobacterium amazonense]|uniref:TrfA family protein n=1 Tax=Chromobacterium amazonense TaxID=1382803 RepID=A0A2S9WYH7_9NEIS|nr:plasmid replication initiator TrfA [Chromobacterium amazonense]PRP68513.1 hypothetical protein BUE93_22190 [Chromobacterium amazonense]
MNEEQSKPIKKLESTLKKIQERANTAKKVIEQKGGSLPLFPEMESAMPNHLARSALFAPIRPGRRTIYDKSILASRDDVEILYSGKQLDMADNDVFLQALRASQGYATGAPVIFNRAEFLREIGRSTGKNDYVWLEESFDRLATGTLYIKTKNYKTVLHLIDAYAKNEISGKYWLRLNPEILKLFSQKSYGFIDMDARRQINRGQELAKWLQNYVASHEGGKTHTIDGKSLQKWSGTMGRFRDFMSRSLPKALAELERLCLIQNSRIREDGKVTWYKPTR